MLTGIHAAIKKTNRNILGAGLILLSIILFYVQLISGPDVSFILFYLIIIALAVIYLGDTFPYLIAVVTAAERSYVHYTGYSLGGIAAIWQLISYITVHSIFCYLFSIYRHIYQFIKPDNNQFLEKELSSSPSIKEFIFRPYVNRYWNLGKRLSMIASHYKLVKNHIPFLNLTPDESKELTQFYIGNEKLRLILDRPQWMRREGELGLSLFYGIDRIYTVMFLLSGKPDHLQLIIGNFQGDGRNRADLYKELTKAMYGMRPRDFLLHSMKILGEELGCKEILCISDDAHRSSHFLSNARKLSAYDEIWLEHGGKKIGNTGFFNIPSRMEKRPIEEIQTKKRSLYRQRYHFLDDLQLKLRAFISNQEGNHGHASRTGTKQ